MSEISKTRLRPLIRYLGLAVGVVVGTPSLIGCGWFLSHPEQLMTDPGSTMFAFLLGGLASWATWRWMSIGGTSTGNLIQLRGWFSTVEIAPDSMTEIRRVTIPGSKEWHYEIFDYRGQSLGVIPGALHFCKDWESFLDHLRAVARTSKSVAPDSASSVFRHLSEKDVDEWTMDDLTEYEENG